jgi:hypothetical protein
LIMKELAFRPGVENRTDRTKRTATFRLVKHTASAWIAQVSRAFVNQQPCSAV